MSLSISFKPHSIRHALWRMWWRLTHRSFGSKPSVSPHSSRAPYDPATLTHVCIADFEATTKPFYVGDHLVRGIHPETGVSVARLGATCVAQLSRRVEYPNTRRQIHGYDRPVGGRSSVLPRRRRDCVCLYYVFMMLANQQKVSLVPLL